MVIARELWAMRVIVNVFSIEASGWTDLIHVLCPRHGNKLPQSADCVDLPAA